ncbi:MAG: methylated-DNA--[protein]-cysteine S-methyltransferase [Flavobacteriales bacterium]|nr:methylated-DNA--[protein]-cysteine S-methyltransferase [Flavobacteriales bacterium]
MDTNAAIDFARIEKAINYLHSNFKQQPSLEEVAEHVHLSPFHFQRMFSEWAGTSPKKFLQYLSLEHAKKMLKVYDLNLMDAAFETGLSGTGRLHDLFVNIEGMTPAEFKHGGRQLEINYSYSDSLFGKILAASTPKGICHASFCEHDDDAMAELQSKFPNARFSPQSDLHQQDLLSFFNQKLDTNSTIKLHLKGTPFQLKVWESLLKIPKGGLTTYGHIAQNIQAPKASRAVGTAIGSNPVAFLIPCHRVIRATGIIGEYKWRHDRKVAMIGWEAANAG